MAKKRNDEPPPANAETTTNGSGGNKPAASFRHHSAGGIVEVAVWSHEVQGDNGPFTSYSVTCSRSYKDGNDWKRTSSLRAGDIPLLLIALQDAFRWVCNERASAKEEIPI